MTLVFGRRSEKSGGSALRLNVVAIAILFGSVALGIAASRAAGSVVPLVVTILAGAVLMPSPRIAQQWERAVVPRGRSSLWRWPPSRPGRAASPDRPALVSRHSRRHPSRRALPGGRGVGAFSWNPAGASSRHVARADRHRVSTSRLRSTRDVWRAGLDRFRSLRRRRPHGGRACLQLERGKYRHASPSAAREEPNACPVAPERHPASESAFSAASHPARASAART